MKINGKAFRTIWFDNNIVKIIDQTKLPHQYIIKDLKSIIQLTKIIRKEKPELIISFTPKAGFISLVVSKLFARISISLFISTLGTSVDRKDVSKNCIILFLFIKLIRNIILRLQ